MQRLSPSYYVCQYLLVAVLFIALIGGKKPHQICRLGLSRTFQMVKPFASKTVLYNVTVGAFAKTGRRFEAGAKALKVLEFLQMADKKDALAKHLTLPERKRLEDNSAENPVRLNAGQFRNSHVQGTGNSEVVTGRDR